MDSEISNLVISDFDKIPLEIMTLSGAQKDFVQSDGYTVDSLRNGVINIKFKYPVYVHDVTFWTPKETFLKLSSNVEVCAKNAEGEQRNYSLADSANNYSDCRISEFLSSLRIELKDIKKSTFLKSPLYCTKIEILGFTKDRFGNFIAEAAWYIHESKRLAGEMQKQHADISLREDQLEKKINSHERYIDEIPDLKNELEKLREKNLDLAAAASKEQNKADLARADFSKTSEQNKRLETENAHLLDAIYENKTELESILADRNIFREEFRDYVRQGRSSNFVYLCCAAALFALASACVIYLIVTAAGLAKDIELLLRVGAFDLLLSRTPFALAIATVAGLLMAMINKLLHRIFEVHQERLLLSKLSILAKDVVSASAIGLDLTPEQIFDKKTQIKGDLLKDLLIGRFDDPASPKASKARLDDVKGNQSKTRPE